MIATQLQRASFALIVLAIGLSLAVAQDDPPIVDSEVIGSVPFRSTATAKALTEADLKTQFQRAGKTPSVTDVAPAAAFEAVNSPLMTRMIASSDPCQSLDKSRANPGDHPLVQFEASRMPITLWLSSVLDGPLAGVWLAATLRDMRISSPSPASAMRCPITTNEVSETSTCIPSTPAETTRPDVAHDQPAPLSPSDSEMFASSTPRSTSKSGAGNGDSLSQQASASAPRLPKMTKMFSFDTIDKVARGSVAPAGDQFNPELTLDLAGPESVSVNQVFQQLVHIRNSSSLPLLDVRVTQVCDLRVLGAERQQAVTIDCVEPGETKTVRFSARARQAGTFAVRYVAENSRIQADVNDLVQVSGASLSPDVARPTNR